MPVEGLHPVLESTLNSLIGGGSELTSWKMFSKSGTHTVTLFWKDIHADQNSCLDSQNYTAYRKKPPCQVKRDRERRNRRKDSKSDSGLVVGDSNEQLSKSCIDLKNVNEHSLLGDHYVWPSHVTSAPVPWTPVQALNVQCNEFVDSTCMIQPSVQQYVNSACDQTLLKQSVAPLQSSVYIDCTKPIHFTAMESLSSKECEMEETAQTFRAVSQEKCDILESDLAGFSQVNITEPPTLHKDLSKLYWIPAPDEDADLIFTCTNCNLNLDISGLYYECRVCFSCYCQECYSRGIHSKHNDKFIANLLTKSRTSYSSDSESESVGTYSSCSSDFDIT